MSNILNAIMNRTELQTFRDQRVVWKLSDVMACGAAQRAPIVRPAAPGDKLHAGHAEPAAARVG